MVVRLSGVIALVAALAGTSQAQQKIEVGTGLGVAILTNGGSLTNVGIPGGGIASQFGVGNTATLHASFGNRLMITPELAFSLTSGGGETLTTIGLVGNVGYLLAGSATNSPYIAASGAFQFIDVGSFGNATSGAAGAKVGYRLVVGGSLAVRFEAGYRRWFGDVEANEILIGVRLGALIGG
jgi:hypothetical protein